jgi:hypothetical protein
MSVGHVRLAEVYKTSFLTLSSTLLLHTKITNYLPKLIFRFMDVCFSKTAYYGANVWFRLFRKMNSLTNDDLASTPSSLFIQPSQVQGAPPCSALGLRDKRVNVRDGRLARWTGV